MATPQAAAPSRCVALLGGSFDPVHQGHTALARQALAHLPIDELWWLPVGQAWQKRRALTPPHHRLAMLELAVGNVEGGRRQRIETCELHRPGPTYTIETMAELAHRHPGTRWMMILGADQFQGLPTWHRWGELARLLEFAVAVRPGAKAELPASAVQGAAPAGGVRWQALPMQPLEVSSTDIRSRVAQGRGLEGLVPPEVARYIAEHRLYQRA